MNKWVEIKPIGYIGLILFLLGILGPDFFNIHGSLIRWLGILLGIIGMSIAFKGRKEKGS
jgi:hypothetical protein